MKTLKSNGQADNFGFPWNHPTVLQQFITFEERRSGFFSKTAIAEHAPLNAGPEGLIDPVLDRYFVHDFL